MLLNLSFNLSKCQFDTAGHIAALSGRMQSSSRKRKIQQEQVLFFSSAFLDRGMQLDQVRVIVYEKFFDLADMFLRFSFNRFSPFLALMAERKFQEITIPGQSVRDESSVNFMWMHDQMQVINSALRMQP